MLAGNRTKGGDLVARETAEQKTKRRTLRLTPELDQGIAKVAGLSEMGESEWMHNALERQVSNDLAAHERMEVRKLGLETVTTPDQCIHPLQWRVQGVFAKYCGACGGTVAQL